MNANKAAQGFSDWLHVNKPVSVRDAVQQFQAIGRRYQSTDNAVVFIWTLEHARACLAFLEKEGR